MKQGYISNSKWHYRHFKDREFIIGYFYRGQLTKRNIVSLYPFATSENKAYFTDDGNPIPVKVYLALLNAIKELEGGEK